MSIAIERRMREARMRGKLERMFPGMRVSRRRPRLSLEEMELIVNTPYGELSDSLKSEYENFLQNSVLSGILGRGLDYYYNKEEVSFYLVNPEIFKASFASFRGFVCSAEFIIEYLEKRNFIVREALESDGKAVLLCDMKYIDKSDKFNPLVAYRKVRVSLPTDTPGIFVKIANNLIGKIKDTASRRSVVYGHVDTSDIDFSEVTE